MDGIPLRRLSIATLLVAFAASAIAAAQGPRASATLTVDKSTVAAGATVTGRVTVTFPDGYHAYQNPPSEDFEIPLKLEAGKASKFKLVKVTYPKGTPMSVGGEPKPSAVYTDTIVIPVVLKAPAGVGASSVSINVNYQQCNASSCLPPDMLELTAKLTVKPAAKKTSKPKKS